MNVHAPSDYEETKLLEVSQELVTRAATSEKPDDAANAAGGQAFDETYPEIAQQIAERDQKVVCVTELKARLKKAEKPLSKIAPGKEVKTGETTGPLSLIERIYIGVLALLMIADPFFAVYAAATFLAASGLIDNVTTRIEAVPFAFPCITVMWGMKSLGDSRVSSRARARIKTVLLSLGTACGFGLVYCLSFLANPSTAKAVDIDATGAGTIAVAHLDFWPAVALMASTLCTTMLIGAGLAMQLRDDCDANKVKRWEPSQEFENVKQEVSALRDQCDQLETEIAVLNSVLKRAAKRRDAFLWLIRSRVRGLRDWLDAEKARLNAENTLAYHKVMSMAASGEESENGEHK